MPSLILVLVLTVGAAWLATRPPGGAWLDLVLQAGPAHGPVLLSAGWTVAFLAQGLAAWAAWRGAGRHAWPVLSAFAAQLVLFVAWPWALLEGHRPGWALGVVTLACLLQGYLLSRARSISTTLAMALLPAAAWLPWLWWMNYGWWHASGGGPGSLIG